MLLHSRQGFGATKLPDSKVYFFVINVLRLACNTSQPCSDKWSVFVWIISLGSDHTFFPNAILEIMVQKKRAAVCY